MSTTNPTTNTQNPTKPFTANFQLQTKIRTIIQQVLAATIRKLSVFNQKIDKFQDYFMMYKEKIETLEKSCHQNRQAIALQYDQRLKSKKEFANQVIKAQEVQQNNMIKFDQIQNEVTEISKTIKQCQRQNQNLNSELSKTKGRFMEYSNVISALKQEVSWKITKYIEETADTNTEIKINNEAMKKQYFNVMLMLEKQKEKYQKIIQLNESHQNNTKRLFEDIQRLDGHNQQRIDENKRTLEKMDEYDTILQSKLKTLDSKCELRISQLQADNKKSMNAVKKLQTFNDKIEDIQQEVQRNNRQLIKKIEEINKKTKDETQVEMVRLSKELLKVEKTMEKKLGQLQESTQKAQDFLTQKIDFMKMEIENELTSHTSQLMKEKEDSSKVNSSTMDQVNQRINKFNMEIQKNISKLQTTIKQTKSQLKKEITNMTQTLQTKLQTIEAKPRRKSSDDESSKLSPQMLKQIEEFSFKITRIQERLLMKDVQIQEIKQNEGKTELFQKEMIRKIDTYFKDQQEDMSNKVEKIMFLVTKMRGDNIVRNEFIEKEIKQIKKNHSEYKTYTDTLLKLTPAIGQCINLILSLIYDAEYQHSKIIQDNLPLLKKDQEKFNTCLEGVLYEFKQKKKPGVICYRHKDIKKTDIVKATFNGYIKVWEELFENEFKNKAQYLPKGFYKKAVEKVVNNNGKTSVEKTERVERQQRRENSLSVGKQTSFYQKLANNTGYSRPLYDNQRRQNSQKQQQRMTQSYSNNGLQSMNHMASRQAVTSLKKIQEEEKLREIKQTINSKQGLEKGDNMNSSFHIRKKKTVKKEEVMVVNITSVGQ